MTKIENVSDLRNVLTKALQDLAENKIDVSQAVALSKVSDSIISTLHAELAYSKLTDQKPNIDFLNTKNGRLIEGKKLK